MKLQWVIIPESDNDILEAFLHYADISDHLVEKLENELLEAREVLCVMPYLGQQHRANIHRWFLKRFPYGIFYTVTRTEVIVLAFWHQHRNPKDLALRLNTLG